jgi:hypothetical protein
MAVRKHFKVRGSGFKEGPRGHARYTSSDRVKSSDDVTVTETSELDSVLNSVLEVSQTSTVASTANTGQSATQLECLHLDGSEQSRMHSTSLITREKLVSTYVRNQSVLVK